MQSLLIIFLDLGMIFRKTAKFSITKQNSLIAT